jgi:hypothetical protein
MTYNVITFEELIKRIREIGYDFKCFKELAINYYPKTDSELQIKKYINPLHTAINKKH